MIVDCHVRIWQRPEQVGLTGPHNAALSADVSDLAEASHDVDVSIVLGFRAANLDLGVPNDFISEFVASQPERLIGFASIDPNEADAREQLKEAIERLSLKGVVLAPAWQNIHPMDARCLQLYEVADQLSVPVVFLSSLPPSGKAAMRFGRPELIDEVAQEFPRLRILITSMGYPFLAETVNLLEKSENVFADLAGLTRRPQLLYQVLTAATEAGITEKLLFGSHFPFTLPKTAIEAIYSVNAGLQGTGLPIIPRENLSAIIQRDALATLGISQTASSGKGK